MESKQSAPAPVRTWIGIDISKDTFEVHLVGDNDTRASGAFDNVHAGHVKFLKWARRQAPEARCHFCMEATGSYGTALAEYLAEAKELVSVANPALVKFSGRAQGASNKTDRGDARIIADYCRKEKPAPWRAAEPHVRTLIGLVRYLDVLKTDRTAQQNRHNDPGTIPEVRASLEVLLTTLNQQIKAVEKQIRDHIDSYDDLKRDRDLLMSIPGIAETTAALVLALMPAVADLEDAKQAAAAAGINPANFESGTSVHRPGHITKGGDALLRKGLIFPAMTAMRHNPLVHEFAKRLRDKGKHKMVVLIASMRKLLMIAYGVLKNRTPFQVPA